MSYKVIDISQWQGVIDWDKVAPCIDGAIIRAGWGSDYIGQDDSQFERNCAECERLGIPYGVYLYSYALSTSQARSEAQHILRLLQGKNISLPVYFDSEESNTAWCAKDNAIAFCEVIRNAGYTPGVYASLSWWQNNLQGVNGVSKWVARWQTDSPGMDCDIWQYTSDGSVPGISGRVDMNICYMELVEMTDQDLQRIITGVWEYIYNRGNENQDRTLEGCGIDAESNGYNVIRQAFLQSFSANQKADAILEAIKQNDAQNGTCMFKKIADILER